MLVQDDADQAKRAANELAKANLIIIPDTVFVELVWALKRGYCFKDEDIADAISALINTANVRANRTTVEAGLATLNAGGDFADGAIWAQGAAFGGGTFVSFDRDAVRILGKAGNAAREPE